MKVIIAAFQRIGDGDYAPQVPERGPHELVQLSRGFNQMVRRLVDMARRKDRLEEQLVEVQEEERAELARDLHDEIGPLLFAVSVDLTALERYETIRTDAQLLSRLNATGEAIARMQQHVKAILGRLRPPTIADLGLLHSTERLVAFWRTRYPGVTFHVDISYESSNADVGARIYRIVQESVSNALRHGDPGRIDIDIARESDESLLVEVCDDGVGLQPDRTHSGLGLVGCASGWPRWGVSWRLRWGPAAGVSGFVPGCPWRRPRKDWYESVDRRRSCHRPRGCAAAIGSADRMRRDGGGQYPDGRDALPERSS